MSWVYLDDPRKLGRAVRQLGKQMEAGSVKALRNAARYGATQAIATSSQTVPRPRAHGSYERSFVVTKLTNGAALSNSSKAAIFVELGRKPGKAPPEEPIISWIKAKRDHRRSGVSKTGAQGWRGKAIGRKARTREGRKQLRILALLIRRKIARRGYKGRYVLKRTMPLIAKRVLVELELMVKREVDRLGRGMG